MARKRSRNGKRCRYILDDGTSWDVFEAQAKMVELHKEPASISLMQQRLTHSTDPEYVFLKKKGKWTKDGGHVYSQKNFARKKALRQGKPTPKFKPKRVVRAAPKLTAQEKAIQKALKSLGIAWT
jgi:hypothetical protein